MLSMKERSNAINDIIKESVDASNEAKEKQKKKELNMRESIELVKENAEYLREVKRNYKGIVREELLATAFKSMYITALESVMLLDSKDYSLAEALVDRYVRDNNAGTILRHMNGKTYLLDRIRMLVEDGTEEADDKASLEDKENKQVPDETKDNMIEDMDKEEDVNNAVEIIAKRISSAEEEFIKKNAEDKQKIQDIVAGINDRLQSVKNDITKDEETKDQVEKECAIETAKKINDLRDMGKHSLYEHMMFESTKNIVKDAELTKLYAAEDGKLDMDKVSNTVRVMYGFLEFVNTVQLEKVNESYIEKLIKELY